MLQITKYADRLIDDLDGLDYIERVKLQQKNWIGRSHRRGGGLHAPPPGDDMLTVYTTRPDTLFGRYLYGPLPGARPPGAVDGPAGERWSEVQAYQEAAARKSDLERTELNKEKTGVKLQGVRAVNPVNGKEIPIFISDYVLVTYGTGAIMASARPR
ncbi:MAG: hypothetical protein ACLSHU_06335 [Oscillospiraceae bacterium]